MTISIRHLSDCSHECFGPRLFCVQVIYQSQNRHTRSRVRHIQIHLERSLPNCTKHSICMVLCLSLHARRKSICSEEQRWLRLPILFSVTISQILLYIILTTWTKAGRHSPLPLRNSRLSSGKRREERNAETKSAITLYTNSSRVDIKIKSSTVKWRIHRHAKNNSDTRPGSDAWEVTIPQRAHGRPILTQMEDVKVCLYPSANRRE